MSKKKKYITREDLEDYISTRILMILALILVAGLFKLTFEVGKKAGCREYVSSTSESPYIKCQEIGF